MTTRIQRTTRVVRQRALRIMSSLTIFIVVAAPSCPPSGGPVTYLAGFAFRTPQRNSDCTATATANWVDAQAGLSWKIGGFEPRSGACGFVVRSDTNPITVKAKLRVLCSQVGNDMNPPSGQCNNGDHSTANMIWFTNISATLSAPHTDSVQYTLERDAMDLAYFATEVPFSGRPAGANANGDFQYKAEVSFQRLGLSPTAAAASLTVSGQIEHATKEIVGPSVVIANSQAGWRLSGGTYNARLYRIRWFLDNDFAHPWLTDSVWSGGVGGPGVRNLKALVMLADSIVDSVSFDFRVQARASIIGPNAITVTGYYTWSAEDPGTSGSTPSYSWQLYDATSATWTTVGSGASLVIPVSGSGPSRDFWLRVDISADGYISNTTTVQVTNYLIGDCGGNACLKSPSKGSPKAKPSPARSRGM